MAKLYFSYAAMNAGKSTILLQASYNYRERGMRTLLFTSALYANVENGQISSRIGVRAEAKLFNADDDLYAWVAREHDRAKIDCVFVDEAQFLTRAQVWQLARVADRLKIPVLCYGLRTDFRGDLFEGSAELLAIADSLREVRTICHCGAKATWSCAVTRLEKRPPTANRCRFRKTSTSRSAASIGRMRWGVAAESQTSIRRRAAVIPTRLFCGSIRRCFSAIFDTSRQKPPTFPPSRVSAWSRMSAKDEARVAKSSDATRFLSALHPSPIAIVLGSVKARFAFTCDAACARWPPEGVGTQGFVIGHCRGVRLRRGPNTGQMDNVISG
jgi:thymidine kinase